MCTHLQTNNTNNKKNGYEEEAKKGSTQGVFFWDTFYIEYIERFIRWIGIRDFFTKNTKKFLSPLFCFLLRVVLKKKPRPFRLIFLIFLLPDF